MKTFFVEDTQWEVVKIDTGSGVVYALYNSMTNRFLDATLGGGRFVTAYLDVAKEKLAYLRAQERVSLASIS